jgi:hypothetical protein
MGEITASNYREEQIFGTLCVYVKGWGELLPGMRDAWKLAALDDIEIDGVFEIAAHKCVTGEPYTIFEPKDITIYPRPPEGFESAEVSA